MLPAQSGPYPWQFVDGGVPAPGAPRATGAAAVTRVGAGSALLLHIPLGIALHHSVALATVYGAAILLVALGAAFTAGPVTLLCVAAYAASAEVLWRMAGGLAPWEGAKYTILLLAAAGLVRGARRERSRMRLLPLVYLVALLPSILATAGNGAYATPRMIDLVSFNLSGPFALGISAWFASTVSLTRHEFRRVLAAGLAPVLGIVAVTLFSTYAEAVVTYTAESNFATSGGYGPNQVSAVLGLGVLFCLPALLDATGGWKRRAAFGAAALACLTQSVMTFSRGGLYSLAAALLVASPYMLRARETRRAFAVGVLVLGTLFGAVLMPRLNTMTAGALDARFAETTSSHRDEIMAEDWRLWGEHPVLGLGPGGAQRERRTESRIAHTEYTRLLSEHGVFGLVALCALLAMAGAAFAAPQTTAERALRALWVGWALFSMGHLGMRVTVLPFVFALGQVRRYDAPPRPRGDARAGEG